MLWTAQQLAEFISDTTQIESDEPEMESSLHYVQLALLVTCLEWWWRDRQDFFIGATLSIYYSPEQLKTKDFRGPDFFLVKDTVKKHRRSWVVWQENGKYPDLIVELLSDSTARVDRQEKKDLYQNRFQTPEYFWFSPDDLELAGWRLDGGIYQPITANATGQLWSEQLELYLGLHQEQLRYFTATGELVLTLEEVAIQFQSIAEQERQRAETLAAQRQALGIEPQS